MEPVLNPSPLLLRRLLSGLLGGSALVALGCGAGAIVGPESVANELDRPGTLSQFTLINADTDKPISGFDSLVDGATLNRQSLPTQNLNISATTTPAEVGSVRFDLDGRTNFHTENAAPYALASNSGADYFSMALTMGAHTLTATPFSGSNRSGTAGAARTVHFTVVDVAVPAKCALRESGPIVATEDGQVIENVRVTSTSGPGITVQGKKNVVIRNCEILHSGGPGISVKGADGVRIENCRIVNTEAPASGPNPNAGLNNIDAYRATRLSIDHVRLVRGSSGMYLLESPGAQVHFVEGHDFRGPMPRGQLLQLNNSSDSVLEDFSVENGATSWPEDNISAYGSSNVAIRRGVIRGNNSQSGVGVMFEQGDPSTGVNGGLVEDVDAVNMGNGAFSAYPGRNITFRRTRMRDNVCTDQGRGAPLSGGLSWAGMPGSSWGNRIEAARMWNDCKHQPVWDATTFAAIDLTEENFTPRAVQKLEFCWAPPAL